MGKGNDRRTPRRRGFDDDNFAPDWGAPPPRFFGDGGGRPPRAPMPPAGPPVAGKVKWFNATKGFGFVELSDGTGDAFLHVAVLERSGHGPVDPGTTLKVTVSQGVKGAQVSEVLEVDASTATPLGRGFGAGPRPGGPARRAAPSARPPSWSERSSGTTPPRASASSASMTAARTSSCTLRRCRPRASRISPRASRSGCRWRRA